MPVSVERLREVQALVSMAQASVGEDPNVLAAVLVGSYAYGRPTTSSDVDLVLVAADPAPLISNASWITSLVGDEASLVREQDWGPLRERRFRLESGLEVEVGIVPQQWLTVPVEPGAARVLRDGCVVVFDRSGLARAALESLGLAVRTWGPDRPPTNQASET